VKTTVFALSWSTKVTDTSSVSGTVSRASAAIRPRVSFMDPSPSMILLRSANAASGSRLAPSQDDSTVISPGFHTARIPFKDSVGLSCPERDAPIRRDASLRGSISFTQGQPTISSREGNHSSPKPTAKEPLTVMRGATGTAAC
jgi:hypothetical protein